MVATSGTAMTTQHLKSLSRLAGRIRLAFDGDRAGVNATERVINLAQEVGVELEVVSLPDGVKDPDELIQKIQRFGKRRLTNLSQRWIG